MRRLLLLLLAVFTLAVTAPSSRAAEPLDGAYAGSVELGPVLLDGVYPFTVGESSPGRIDVTTLPNGTLDARVTFALQTEDAVGQISVRGTSVRLVLRGKVDEGRIRLTASLRGSAFVGTVSLRGRTQPCSVDVSACGPIRATCALTLTSTSSGNVSGTGSITIARQVLPVTVRGKVRKDGVALVISGGGITLRFTKAPVDEGSITAPRWNARGFGASLKRAKPFRLAPV